MDIDNDTIAIDKIHRFQHQVSMCFAFVLGCFAFAPKLVVSIGNGQWGEVAIVAVLFLALMGVIRKASLALSKEIDLAEEEAKKSGNPPSSKRIIGISLASGIAFTGLVTLPMLWEPGTFNHCFPWLA